MNESVSYEPPADVQKTGVEDAASRPRFRTFSAGALNFHSKGGKNMQRQIDSNEVYWR